MQTMVATAGQMNLARAIRDGGRPPPRVRPVADPALTESFLRAAAAWERWRERRKWLGR